MTEPMRRALFVFLATTALGVAVVGVAAYKAWQFPDTPAGTARGPVDVEIPRGAGAGQVADLLAEKGLLDKPTWFRLYAGQRGVASRFKAGHYRIQAPATPKQLLDTMVKGAADELVAVTIPEGKNFVEIADILETAGVTRKAEFIAAAINPTLIQSLNLNALSLEGYLFPDTYKLRPNTPATNVVIPMVRRHRQVYAELRAANAEGVEDLRKRLGFGDKQIVILASIVEKEAARAEERPRIAQVNINRLTLPSFPSRKLDMDSSIIYGCTVAPLYLGRISDACRQFKNMNIQTIHLRDPHNEYSTYAIKGLPPGPIANPGRASLRAVMKPDKSPFLFFVAKGEGYHHFSVTLQEHEAAVVKFQRGGKPMAPR